MKQKVTIFQNKSFVIITQDLQKIIDNGGEIIQLVNAGVSFDFPDWVVIYKQ